MTRFEANLAMSMLILLVLRTDPAPDPVGGTILGLAGLGYTVGAIIAAVRAGIALRRDK